ncbi:EF-hand calcium-binding domain-containing protein 1 [Aplysia californica]|uniref:EF-hand calcium-binding domain-containing protein 1 n=1 Tax=Aplysia californica TaxID=6500 RepID=A0ABM0K153_APLCA|nr:EF-hand calcium-binding domain-containing protein 1 [Aplysia californica]
MSTFKRMQDDFNQMVDRLQEYSGLDKHLLKNIAMYAKCLPRKDSDMIDEPIFMAQMSNRFKLSNSFMISRIYSVTKTAKAGHATVEEYCRLICTFLTDSLDTQIDFVFRVYDTNQDGGISQLELVQLLRPCVTSSDEDVDLDEALRELIEVVMQATDTNQNGTIDLEEFRQLVKKDILMLQCLGPCLPHQQVVKQFRKLIEGKAANEGAETFANERKKSLKEVEIKSKEGLYPIKLELP